MAHPAHEQEHPGPSKYVQIAIILAVITAMEVATFYVSIGAALIPILLVLSIVKFAMVVMYFMHLKFDSKLFTGFFVSGLMVAAVLVIAFILLLGGPRA